MKTLMERFTSPCIKLYWRGYFKKLWAAYFPDSREDRALLRQFLDDAGFRGQGHHVCPEQLDAVLTVASNHGYWVETIGEEADVLTSKGN